MPLGVIQIRPLSGSRALKLPWAARTRPLVTIFFAYRATSARNSPKRMLPLPIIQPPATNQIDKWTQPARADQVHKISVKTGLAAEALQHLWVAELRERTCLDLAHALARDAQLAAHLFQRIGVAVAQTEA